MLAASVSVAVPLSVQASKSDGGVAPLPPNSLPDGGLPGTYDDRVCGTCHNAVLSKPFRHSQSRDGNCWDCHLTATRASGCKGVALGSAKTVTDRAASYSVEVSVVGWRLKEPEPKLCRRCHEGIADEEPIHKAVKVGGCSVCHDAHSADRKKQLILPAPKLCATCHRRVDRGRFVHQPVAEGDCLACHDPHSGLDNPLLKDKADDLCVSCHERKKLSVLKHRASKQGCLECHAAHASDEAKLLRPKKPPLPKGGKPPEPKRPEAAVYSDEPCAGCHKVLEKKYRHSFFKDGTCGDCHLPSDQPGACKGPVGKGWKLRQEDPALCLACHDGVKADTALHKPIELRGCTACHDPHSSDVKKELKEPQEKLCYRCHARKDTFVASHQVVVAGECTRCHDPHSGSAAPLLKDEPGALCTECHDKKKLLPNPEQHEPVAKARCPECHDPHGTNRQAMLLESGAPLCLKCHQAGAKGRDGAPAAKTQLRLAGPASVHDPVKNDDCQTCHVQSHTSTRKKLLKQDLTRLCLRCHDGLKATTAWHQVIDDKGCVACHLPHTSENKKLLNEWPVEKLCHRCHDQAKTKENLSNVHTPVKKGQCLDCHDPHSGEERPLLKTAKTELCFDCHKMKDLAKEKEVHTAVREGRCTDCHDAHASESEKMLFASGPDLCLRCHDAKKPDRDVLGYARIDLSKKVVHKPLVEKGCQACHVTTHSGKYRKLLLKPPKRLCLECHDKKDQKPYLHSALRLGDCPVCHRPHTADQKNLSPWAREARICFECHEDDITGRASIHKPVAEGKCSKCHDPHGGDAPGNLKVGPTNKALCLTCHDDKIKVAVAFKHKPLERYGCIGCHDPHAAGNPAMLAKPVNELCNSCHRDKNDGQHVSAMVRGGHMISGDADPRRHDRAFSCASCHNPHGSDNPRFFYFGRDGFEMCDGCHGDRTGKNPQLGDVSKRARPPRDGGVEPRDAGLTAWTLPDDDEAPARPLLPDGGAVAERAGR